LTARQLCKLRKSDTKELWTAVRQLTVREHQPAADPSITAEALNQHYANVSLTIITSVRGKKTAPPKLDYTAAIVHLFDSVIKKLNLKLSSYPWTSPMLLMYGTRHYNIN